MVVDASALVALLSMEAEAARISVALESDPSRIISAATLVAPRVEKMGPAAFGHRARTSSS